VQLARESDKPISEVVTSNGTHLDAQPLDSRCIISLSFKNIVDLRSCLMQKAPPSRPRSRRCDITFDSDPFADSRSPSDQVNNVANAASSVRSVLGISSTRYVRYIKQKSTYLSIIILGTHCSSCVCSHTKKASTLGLLCAIRTRGRSAAATSLSFVFAAYSALQLKALLQLQPFLCAPSVERLQCLVELPRCMGRSPLESHIQQALIARQHETETVSQETADRLEKLNPFRPRSKSS